MAIDIEQKNEPTDEEVQKWVDEVYQYTFEQMVKNDVPPSQMKADLINRGLSATDAETVVNNVTEEINKARKDNGKKDMLFGALWCIGGIIVTVATYSAASNGGKYVIAYGAIIWGAIQFFKGLINSF